jgi:hypothetical protein
MASATQRFTRTSPCPICGGYKELPAGHGQRCYGFLSSDGLYAHCTREEHAGSVPADPSGTSYPHRMIGDCRCGVRHDPNPPSPTNGHGRRIVATYDYVDAHGILQYQTVRYDPKGFAQRHPDSQNGWVWNMHGVRPLIYHLPEILQAIAAGQVICTAEGEEDVEAIRRCGYAATCNHG